MVRIDQIVRAVVVVHIERVMRTTSYSWRKVSIAYAPPKLQSLLDRSVTTVELRVDMVHSLLSDQMRDKGRDANYAALVASGYLIPLRDVSWEEC